MTHVPFHFIPTPPVEVVAADHVGLCLGSSFLGFYAHAGFLKGLVDAGIRPAHVAGCSAGAITGGLYAGGCAPDDLIEKICSPPFRRAFFEPTVPLRAMSMLLNFPGVSGFLTGRSLISVIDEFVAGQRIEQLRAPRLSIAATNITSGRAEVLGNGSLARGIVASAAVPMLFSAVEMNGQHYLDGGIVNGFPIESLCENVDIDTIIVHRVTRRSEARVCERSGPPNIATALTMAHRVIGERVLEMDRERAAASGRKFIECETVVDALPFSLTKKRRHVEAGIATAQASAEEWRAMLGVSLTPGGAAS